MQSEDDFITSEILSVIISMVKCLFFVDVKLFVMLSINSIFLWLLQDIRNLIDGILLEL